MAAATLAPAPESLTIPADNVYQLSVAQYHQMADAGIVTEADRVELVEGLLLRRSKISPLHAFVTNTFRDRMNSMLVGWHTRTQQPITLATSEPEPDGALVRGRRSDYRHQHPAPPNIGIVVEVAESSLPQDRGIKKRTYARAGIPVYWIVNLIDKTVESFSDPSGSDYHSTKIVGLREQLPVVLDGKVVGEISVAALFGE